MNDDPRPNIIVLLADDLGFSDIGCYGSEIRTPHLDTLARAGVTMSSFYNTARCSPSRASLLTGLDPHQTGIGILTGDTRPAGYAGDLDPRCTTLAELLRENGYRTSIIGKWHLARDTGSPNGAWPTRRGFDAHWGPLGGACSYFEPTTMAEDEQLIQVDEPNFHLTEALGVRAASTIREAAQEQSPFFLYLPFTAPHWPLHARPEEIAAYDGVYERGWDAVREDRWHAMGGLGVFGERCPPLSDRDPDVPAWDAVADKDWQAIRMQVYAAQITAMDTAIGEVICALEETGQHANTLILFLSDNGGCAEEIPAGWADEMSPLPYNVPARTRTGERVRKGNDPSVVPGGPATFATYGKPWANVSNTPFREYKHWVHEGGIATPLIAHWPDGGLEHGWDHSSHQLTDIVPTVLEAVGGSGPRTPDEGGPGPDGPSLRGRSMLPSWRDRRKAPDDHPLFFEHEGNAAIRRGRWKGVRKHGEPWELYDLERDRTETFDLAAAHPGLLAELTATWTAWARRCGVRERSAILAQRSSRRGGGLVQEFRSAVTDTTVETTNLPDEPTA
ncbi:arylsulfatase [Brachybacterium sp.]|uniref:arylsulfatase n=1 Tax=Brachybacterium sp. TaxID=1891286 RepID=UPI002ED1CC07